jgi:hypothetical protein
MPFIDLVLLTNGLSLKVHNLDSDCRFSATKWVLDTAKQESVQNWLKNDEYQK